MQFIRDIRHHDQAIPGGGKVGRCVKFEQANVIVGTGNEASQCRDIVAIYFRNRSVDVEDKATVAGQIGAENQLRRDASAEIDWLATAGDQSGQSGLRVIPGAIDR